MSYYQALGLDREPFSNSPDPDLLYRAPSHLECLQHMEIAVRLRRGLNVVLGEVGTGKTTLGRELTRLLAADPAIEVHFLDDPYHATPVEFLLALARLFGLDPVPLGEDAGLLREALKTELLRRGRDGGRIVALIVDEGQKITPACLELLRELLNFETNTHKLLQIVIFAQTEFEDILAARPNLEDRVNFRYHLLPLSRKQTRRMIETRLALCAPNGPAPTVFTALALRRIHRLTGGYPRKIVRLCHLSMLLAVGFGKRRIGWGLVGRAAREQRGAASTWLRRGALAGGCVLAGLLTLGLWGPGLPPARHAALELLTRAAASLDNRPAASLAPSAGEGAAVAATTTLVAPSATVAQDTATPLAEAAKTPDPAAAETATAPPEQYPLTPPSAVAGRPGLDAPAAEVKQRQDLGAALDLAAAALPPSTPEQVIVVAPEDGLPAVPAGISAPAAPALPPALSAAPPAVQADAAGATGGSEPASLGSSVIHPGWVVSRLAAKLYGSGGRRVLSALAKANPGKDFNRLRAGETIVYPPITAQQGPPVGSYLVKVAGVENLEKGFAFIARHQGRQGTLLSLFCTKLPETGLRFDVVLPTLYPDQATAETALAALPRDLAAKAVLLGGYPSGTTYYTDLGESVAHASAVIPAAGRQMAERQTGPLPARP